MNWKYWLELGVGAALSGTVIGFIDGFMKGFATAIPIAGLNISGLAAGILCAYFAEKQPEMSDIRNILTGVAAASIGIGVEGIISGFIPKAAA